MYAKPVTGPYISGANAAPAQPTARNDMGGCIPRITLNMLPDFCNQTVTFFGRATGVDHENWKVHTECPLSSETLVLSVEQGDPEKLKFSVNNQFLLKVGKTPQEVSLLGHVSLTDNFDFESYKGLMQHMWGHTANLFHS
mmetsp:Transcript_759/g.1118  ORF Transcript_759/g.1118 Transcript_759/m.1118 type:complete len:140 (+) Transcript_759:63-482(+)